jgi:hypothetical protein
MDRCATCGAALAVGVSWCGQCYSPAAVAKASPPEPGSLQPPGWRPLLADVPVETAARTTRWRKTTTTFGPVGRVLCTLFLVVPFPVLTVLGFVADPFCLGGAVIWGFVLMPWGLRDVWRAGRLSTA